MAKPPSAKRSSKRPVIRIKTGDAAPQMQFKNDFRGASPTEAMTVRFPAAWSWFFDEAIPAWVKQHYSPKESWKNKPFTREEARFFFKGVDELSEIFTEERSRSIPDYFSHPKYRSAYLLYFLPLQAAKFVTAFQLHPKALDAAIAHGRAKGVLRVLDLGAGPGTASLALILQLLQMATHTGEELPPISLHWVDTNLAIMREGKSLIEQLCNQFSRLRGKVTIEIKVAPWWKGAQAISEPASLVLMGHVLNEAAGPKIPRDADSESENAQWTVPWLEIFGKAHGGGILIIEPASKQNSQFLSQLRNVLLGAVTHKEPASIWGPCPHAERCPLTEGRDWCHFSVPAHVPGQWFAEFSKALSSERQWLKFSYMWFSAQQEGATRPKPVAHNMRLVVSDVLTDPRNGDTSVLTCEPETPGRLPVPRISKFKRGDWVKIRS